MIRMMPSAAPPSSQLCVRYLAPADVDEDHGDLLAGLHERPIRIPSRYSYDDRGSELYEARIRQPEYYRSEEHTSELQSLMRNSYAVFCLQQKNIKTHKKHANTWM